MQRGLDLSRVRGSGPSGAVTARDEHAAISELAHTTETDDDAPVHRTVLRLAAFVVASLVASCAHVETATTPSAPSLTEEQVAALIPARVKDRDGWAEDVVAAIRLTKKEPTAERACAVLAVVEQESGYQADPAVPDLPNVVMRALQEKLTALGPAEGPALDALLDEKMPGSDRTVREKIAKLKTERDLDRMFRDVAAAYRAQNPGSFAVAGALSAVLGKGGIEDLNPVTTAGSMQVKVAFAKQLGHLDDDAARDLLYTRAGGVRFGTARLIGYDAHYDDVAFRFADYNSGMFASRNAAFQRILSEMTGEELVLDGDLLAYDKDGSPKSDETRSLRALLDFGAAHGISSWTVHRDAKKEKSADFEETDSWKAVRQAWRDKHGQEPPYARIPDVALVSPKLKHARTTSWYADSVKKRYDACRARP